MSSNQPNQSIEQLQSRYQSFAEQKIKIETQRDHAQEQLEQLKSQALELYGSDDLNELKKMLAQMKTSNEQKRAEYQIALDKIDRELEEINQKFTNSSQGA